MHNKNFKKNDKHVILCKVRIEKKCEHKKSRKIKIALFSLECSIFWGKLEFTHAFSHSSQPFPKKFSQVMHFCKSPWATLIDDTYYKSLQTF
jgi:hypothetical protein